MCNGGCGSRRRSGPTARRPRHPVDAFTKAPVHTSALADHPVEELLDHHEDGTTISVCLPARNEAATVGLVVARIVDELTVRYPLVDEVIVVDDGSTDATVAVARAAGAVVVSASDVLPDCGPATGKGEAMWKALAASSGDVVVWCDADIRDFDPRFVTGLLGPLLGDSSVGFVKACYRRDLDGRPGEGGRVTELVARPLLRLLFPHLVGFAQPLAGECAGRRSVLEQLPFAPGYGVDLALLVDVAAHLGVEAMAQVDLGHRSHRNRPLHELAPQAEAVLAVALARAASEPSSVLSGWRPPLVEVAAYRTQG